MATDLAGFGNNGNPQHVSYAPGPDNTAGRSMLFENKHESRVEIINYDMKLDLSRQLTILAFIYIHNTSSPNATIMAWDGMPYSTKGLSLRLTERHLTASVYPKEYRLSTVKFEADTWYVIGMSYQFYHQMLKLWAKKFGENERAYLAESRVSPQQLGTRGKVILGSSPSLLDAPFSGQLACVLLYDKALNMDDGFRESQKCFNTYLRDQSVPSKC